MALTENGKGLFFGVSDIYANVGMFRNRLTEREFNYNEAPLMGNYGASDETAPGMFEKFHSGRDFVNQIKAPVLMPLISIAASLAGVGLFLGHLAMSIPQCISRDSDEDHFSKSLSFLVASIALPVTAVLDAVWSAITFLTRALSSLVQSPCTIKDACSSEDNQPRYANAY
jgi:hypothetical protein